MIVRLAPALQMSPGHCVAVGEPILRNAASGSWPVDAVPSMDNDPTPEEAYIPDAMRQKTD